MVAASADAESPAIRREGEDLGVPLPPDVLEAIRRHGPSADSIGKRYGISGTALLAKLIQGESGGRGNAVSSAGARGWTQFMPGSRKAAMDKYGVDPWADVDQAVRGAVLHLQGKINGTPGLEGYNPGSSTYTSYILGQKVGNVSKGVSPASSPRAPGKTLPAAGGPSGSGVSAAPFEAPSLQGGTAGNFTGLLANMLQKPQPVVQATQVALPAATAAPPMPEGFRPATPSPVQATQQESGVSDALGLLETLRGTAPSVGASEETESADGVSALSIADSVAAQRAGQQPIADTRSGPLPKSGKNNWGVLEHAGRSGLYLQEKYGIKEIGGYRANDPFPDHPSRKALDLMTYKDTAKGDAIARELTRNFKQHRVKYIIWKQRIWHPGQGWRKMADRGSPTQNHMDHVHVLYE